MSEEKVDASIHEEQATKKQKVEDETKPEQLVLQNGFYTKNFGKNSRPYSFLKEARDLFIYWQRDIANNSEDFKWTDEMNAYEQSSPLVIASKIEELLGMIDNDYPKIDEIVAQRNKESSKKQ